MLNHLEPGKKLLILSACPVLVLMWISVDGVSRRTAQLRDADHLQQTVTFSRNLAQLVQTVQQEMIAAAAAAYRPAATAHQRYQQNILATDIAMEQMVLSIDQTARLLNDHGLRQKTATLKTHLKDITACRHHTLHGGPFNMDAYDLLINDLISVNDTLFSLLDHVNLSDRLHSEIHLALAGQSIARHTAMLARPPNPRNEQHQADIVAEEARYAAYFESFQAHLGEPADNPHIKTLIDNVQPHVMIPKRNQPMQPLTLQTWEQQIVPRMGAFHELDTALFNQLESQTTAFKEQAGKSLVLFAFTINTAIIISLLISIFFARTLVKAQKTADRLQQRRAELDTKNHELEKAKAQLEEKAVALETAARFKSEFLANMSHELRTPLNSLLILTDVLAENREANLTEKQLAFLRTLRGSGAELRNLINEVLDLAKVEAGKMEVLVEAVDLDELVDYVRHNFCHMAEARGLKLELTKDPNLPPAVWTDSRRLKQILKNLLSNAVKFTEHGSISFRLQPREQGIALAVSDTGIGIPAEKQDLVFQAFQQAEGGISRKYGGTGLGLSISKSLAHLLGGRIELESHVGSGSTFTVYLPLALTDTPGAAFPGQDPRQGRPDTTSAATAEAHEERVEDDRGTFSMEDKVLLIIGGGALFARTIVKAGHERGFKVLFAARHEIGRQMARDYDPNAIFLHVGNQSERAVELLKRLKRGAETRHIPVQVVTEETDAGRYARLGAVGITPETGNAGAWDAAFRKIEEVLSRPPKRVLLASGDRILRKFLEDFSKRTEMEVTVAGRGREVFDYLKYKRFDCFAMDYLLEDGNAVDLIKSLCRDDEAPILPGLIFCRTPLSEDKHRLICQYTGGAVRCALESQERVLEEILGFIEDETRAMTKRGGETLPARGRTPRDKNILLVDGDVRNAFALTHLLEERGLTVLHAFEGGEALEVLSGGSRVDLIIMDYTLPDTDGISLVRDIRKTRAEIPLVVISAGSADELQTLCLTEGADAFLAKPIMSSDLLQLLSDLLTVEENAV